MRVVAALAAGGAVYLLGVRTRAAGLADRVGRYLAPPRPPASTEQGAEPPLAAAGLPWSASEVRARWAMAGVTGVALGLLLAQGDLFVAGAERSAPALALLGGLAGALGFRVWVTQRTERRAAQLAAEMPVVIDLIALRVLAGDSVAAALEYVVAETAGVAAEDIAAIVADYRDGVGLSEALQKRAGDHPVAGASRLYAFLANAHQAGGRLAESLLALSTDLRAGEERALAAEGGKRALAVYGPILALMVPAALLFLMYPTLAGLSELSAVP